MGMGSVGEHPLTGAIRLEDVRTALQYPRLSGITPRTPPRGSSISPAYRGMTWTCRCITVWPAVSPTLTPTL